MAEPPFLPTDLLLCIIERGDAATIIRCTATCKLLRRRITSADFRGRLGPRHAVVGLFYRYWSDVPLGSPPFTPTPPSQPVLPDNSAIAPRYTLVASRCGLLVLRSRRFSYLQDGDLCVCNPMTGHRHLFPVPTLYDESHVLLTTGEDGSFRLLTADLTCLTLGYLRTQTFSSAANTWGPVTEVPTPDRYPEVERKSPVVLGSVVHWLCRSSRLLMVLAFHADTARVTSIKIHRSCRVVLGDEILLGSSADGRLSFIVAKGLVISTWTLLEDGKRWARHEVIDVKAMLRSVGLMDPFTRSYQRWIQLGWLGEKSGAVFLLVNGMVMLFLNPRTKEIYQVKDNNCDSLLSSLSLLPFCPFELDLASRLSAMKPY